MTRPFDVGIVGAGVHGVAAAYHLAERGARTLLVERYAPAGGPTGLSSGICRAYYTNPFLAEVARDAISMFERFHELTGADAGHRRTGLFALHALDDAPRVRATVDRLNGLGIVTDLLETADLVERVPGFDLTGVAVGAYEHHAGYADPHATTEGLFNAALSRGAEVRLGTTVVAVDPLGAGGGALVADDGERLECDRILIAAGPWTRRLVSSFGVDLPLTVERHIVGTFAWGTAATVPAFADVPGGYYLRPDGDEGFLVGWLLPGSQVEPDAPVVGVAPDELEALAARVVARVPGLAGAVATGGWASLYDVSPDWQPVIGEVAPGIFVDAGTSGHGFKLAPALGAHVADLVLGMPAHPGLASFSPSRFEAGEDLPAGFGEARILG